MIELAALLIVVCIGVPLALFLLWCAAAIGLAFLKAFVWLVASPVLFVLWLDRRFVASSHQPKQPKS